MKKKQAKKTEVATQGSIKIGKETKETFYRYNMEYDPQIEKPLIDWAMKHIVNDKEALLNYAVNGILKEQIKRMENMTSEELKEKFGFKKEKK